MSNMTKLKSGSWRVRVMHEGVRVSKTFALKANAQQYLRDLQTQIHKGQYISAHEAETTTLREALERYQREETGKKKGAKQEKRRIETWLEHPLANKVLASLKGKHFAAYRDERLAAGRSGSTIQNDLKVIRHLFKIARLEWGMHSLGNPVADIRMPKQANARDRRLLGDEESRLLAACKTPYERGLIVLAIETGMRMGELLAMRYEDVSESQRVAVLHDTKNGEKRVVPLSSRAVKAYKGMPTHVKGNVFPASWSTEAASQRFRRIATRAGIEGLRFHDLRHEATSRLFEQGLGIMEVAAITGHKTLSMLKRYTQLRAEDLAQKLG